MSFICHYCDKHWSTMVGASSCKNDCLDAAGGEAHYQDAVDWLQEMLRDPAPVVVVQGGESIPIDEQIVMDLSANPHVLTSIENRLRNEEPEDDVIDEMMVLAAQRAEDETVQTIEVGGYVIMVDIHDGRLHIGVDGHSNHRKVAEFHNGVPRIWLSVSDSESYLHPDGEWYGEEPYWECRECEWSGPEPLPFSKASPDTLRKLAPGGRVPGHFCPGCDRPVYGKV